MPSSTSEFGATVCEESMQSSIDDLRADINRIKASEASKSIGTRIRGTVTLEWSPGQKPSPPRFGKNSSETDCRLEDILAINPLEERCGRRKIGFSSATCALLLFVTFGNGRRRSDRTHRLLLVSEEAHVLALSPHTTVVMAQAVTLSLSDLEKVLDESSGKTTEVSATDDAPPRPENRLSYLKAKVNEFRRQFEERRCQERENEAMIDKYVSSSVAFVMLIRRRLIHTAVLTAGALVFMIFFCYSYQINLHVNIHVAWANQIWAFGCWWYFTPRRIVESGLGIWTLPKLCCLASIFVLWVQLFGLTLFCAAGAFYDLQDFSLVGHYSS